MLKTFFTFELRSAKYIILNTLQFWESGAESKDRKLIVSRLISKDNLCSIFFFYIIIVFQAVTDRVLRNNQLQRKPSCLLTFLD